MQKNNVFDYSFSLLLSISFLIAGVLWVLGILQTNEVQTMSRTFTEKTESIGMNHRLIIYYKFIKKSIN